MNVISKNLLVNYERQGKGETVLFLHGWGDQLHTFDELTAQLDKNYDVVRLDLAGFGKSQAPNEAWGIDEYADYVAEFTHKIGIKPIALVGHSNGGSIAIKLVAQSKLDTNKLVLLSSAGIRDTDKSRKSALKIVTKIGKIPTMLLPKSTQATLRKKLYTSLGSDMTVAPHMEETFKRIVSQDVQKDAASIAIPTLILYGTADTATPPSYGETFHRLISGSTLITIDSADHFVHRSHSQDIANHIAGFIA